MTETKLANMIVPDVFNAYTVQESTEKTTLIASGIMADLSADLKPQMAGTTVNMPFFNDLSGDDEVMDDTYDGSIAGLTTGQDVSAKLGRFKAFGASDLSGFVSGSDPIGVIQSKFADYWARRTQKIALAVLKGALAADTSSYSMQDNTLDISALSGGAANFDGESFIDACGSLGDAQDALAGCLIHSDTYTAMKKLDLIDFAKDSEGNPTIPYYMGKRVIVDDGMPKLSGGIYHSYIFGPGALGFATGTPPNAVEIGRNALSGYGMDFIVHRRWLSVHLRGVKWVGTPARTTPSNTELSTKGNWRRVYDPKLIRVVRFIHKVA